MRAKDELKGTLYEEMNKQRLLRARYSNVLDVITEYAEHPDLPGASVERLQRC